VDEQKINDLIYEIQRLVNTLGQTKTNSDSPKKKESSTSMTDKSATQLIAALGILSSKLGGAARTRKEEIRAANDFANSVTVAAGRAEKAAEKQAKKSEDFANAAAAAAEQLRRAGLSAKQLAEEQAEEQAAAAKAARKNVIQEAYSNNLITKSQAKLTATLSGVDLGFTEVSRSARVLGQVFRQTAIIGGAAVGVGKESLKLGVAVSKAEVSFTALNPIIDMAASAFSGVPFFSGAAKAAAEGAKILLDQLQQTTVAFQSVAKVGGITESGMSGLRQQQLLSGQTLESFTKTIVTNSGSMAQMSGTVGEGAKTFAATAGLVQDKFGKSLQRLGMGVNEIGETTADYMALQTRLGLSQKMSVAQLAEGSFRYAKELDGLAKVTGTSKDEIKKTQDRALGEARFRAKIEELKSQGPEGEAAAKRLLDFDTMMSKANPRLAEGFRDQATGITNTAASIELNNTLMGQGANISRKMISGELEAIAGMKQSQTALKANMGNINRFAQGMGDVSGVFAPFAKNADFANEVIQDSGDLLRKVQEKQMEGYKPAEDGKPATGDKMTDSVVAAQRSLQQTALAINDLGFTYLPGAAKATEAFTKSLEMASEKINETLGIKQKDIDPRYAQAEKLLKDSPKKYKDKGLLQSDESYIKDALNRPFGQQNALSKEIPSLDAIKKAQAEVYKQSLEQLPQHATGGIAAGPDSGHLAMLHGTEAVIPLAGGAIPVAISGGAAGKGDVGSGPAFSKANEFAAQMDKVIKALDDSNKYLSDIYDEISGGATVGGAGSGSGERVAQEALAEHDHAHPHEPAAAASPELAAQIGKIVMPLEKMNQTSGFGNRMMDGKVQGHGAIDLAGKIGDKVMAPISGIARVLSEKESGGYGNMVEVTDSVTGVKHMLAHLDKSMVKSGDVIKAGQQIGTLGNTGKSTGAHLHHEMRDKQGNKIDPSQFYSDPGFGSTAGGAATGNPQAARRGQKSGATQAGAPTDMATYMKTVAMLESGGDPNAKAGTSNGKYSSAGGLFQFLESSYEGVTGRKGSGAERFDPKKSTEAMQKLTMMNKGQMEKGLGREVSGEDLYMGHFLGAGGATKFLQAKDKDPNQSAAKFDPAAAASNKSIYYDQKDNNRERSMAEVHSLMTEKYRKQQAAIQGGAKLPDVVAALGTGGMPLAGGAPPTAVAAAPTAPTAAVPGYAPEQRAQPAAQPTTLAGIAQNLLGGLFGSSGTTAGIAGPTAPAAGSDMAGITAALQAQTAATQSAITSSMENMTTRLVASLGTTGGVAGGDPAVPALLGDIVSAQREQTAAINRLISVQTA
jgi:murein DD-endopeptidase MepM/ murein hydrolase activator NlpD